MEKISVKKPFTVLVAVVIVLALGVVSMTRMTTDLLPSISLPYLMVITPYPGASPERVESEVSRPLEEALGTVKNVKNVFSVSAENYSMVQLEFASGANMDSAMVNVSSTVNQVSAALPAGCGTPSLLELSMDMIATMYVAVSHEGYDIYELSEYVGSEVTPYFQRQSGVANVTEVGLVEKTVQVDLNAEKIEKLNEKILEQTNSALAEAKEVLDRAQEQVDAGQEELRTQEARFGRTLASALFSTFDQNSGALTDQLRRYASALIGQLEELEGSLGAPAEQGDSVLDTLRSAMADLEAAREEAVWDRIRIEAVGTDLQELDQRLRALENQVDAAAAADMSQARSHLAMALAYLQDAAAFFPDDLDTAFWDLQQAQGHLAQTVTALEQAGAAAWGVVSDPQVGNEFQIRLSGLIADLRAAVGSLDGGTVSGVLSAVSKLSLLPGQINDLLRDLSLQDAAGDLSGTLGEVRTSVDELADRLETSVPGLMAGLETALAQLSQGQLDAALAFAAAAQQLQQAQTQLTAAYAQYDQAHAQALEAANLDALADAATLSQLIYAQNFAMPAGYIDDENDNSWLLRVGDEFDSSGSIADTLLLDLDGVGTIRISDIADITVIDNAGDAYTNLNGEKGIMLCVYKSSTAGTNEVSRACSQAIRELMAEDEGLHIVKLVDQGKYITIIIRSILESMALGALLAIIVLALFLKDLRPTVIVGVSIPLSVLFALVLMYFTDLSLNMMTLSGLALGIGMLVDNSIVVMENITRLRTRGLSAARAAVQGTRQVAGSIIASTLTTICVFFPMVFTTGTVRELLVPLALSVSYCLAASLLVAMTVIPAASSTVLSRVQIKPNRLMERVQVHYGRLLRWCLGHKAVPLLISVLLLAFSVARVLSIGIVVLPEMTSDSVQVNIRTPEEDERETSYAKADRVMDALLTVEGVEDIGIMDYSSVASSVSALSGASGGAYGEYICYVTVPENAGTTEVKRICADIETVTAGLDCTVTASAGSMNDFSSFVRSGLSVNIYGKDMDRLEQIARQVAAAAEAVEGFENVSTGSEDAAATLHLVIDRDRAMEYGLTVAQIYAQIAGRLATRVTSTTITVDGMEMDVTVSDSTDPLTRENLLDMEFEAVDLAAAAGGSGSDLFSMGGALPLDSGEGETEPEAPETGEAEPESETEAETEPEAETGAASSVHKLREFAAVEETLSAASINRENLTRYVTVTADTAPGYNTTVLSRSLQTELSRISRDLPYGYSLEISGEADQVNDMVRQMLELSALGLLFIYLVMVAQFQSLLSPFIILFTVPLAFTGGMLGILVAGQQMSMLALMGFLILMGTVVNNGIVFVDYVNQLRLGGLKKRDALVAAGKTRMRPILMTTLTTVLAMGQLIFGSGMGSQLGGGMAIVIAGGLLYATLMTLFIVPVMYDILYRRQPQNVDVGEDINDVPDDAAEYLAALEAERLAAAAAAPAEKVPAEKS